MESAVFLGTDQVLCRATSGDRVEHLLRLVRKADSDTKQMYAALSGLLGERQVELRVDETRP